MNKEVIKYSFFTGDVTLKKSPNLSVPQEVNTSKVQNQHLVVAAAILLSLYASK